MAACWAASRKIPSQRRLAAPLLDAHNGSGLPSQLGRWPCQGNEPAGEHFANYLSIQFKAKSNPAVYRFYSRRSDPRCAARQIAFRVVGKAENLPRQGAQKQLQRAAATDSETLGIGGGGAGVGGTQDKAPVPTLSLINGLRFPRCKTREIMNNMISVGLFSSNPAKLSVCPSGPKPTF